MLELLLEVDKYAFVFLNSLHITWLDAPMMFCTAELTWLPLYVLLLVLAYRQLGLKKTGWFVLGIVLVIAFADQTTSSLMKPAFQRLRPSHEANLRAHIHLVKNKKGRIYKGGKFGFASSHAANSFGLAMFFFLYFRKQWRGVRLLFLWAALLSYTRIYLGVHYPLDIIVGALVGMFGAVLVFQLKTYLPKSEAKIQH